MVYLSYYNTIHGVVNTLLIYFLFFEQNSIIVEEEEMKREAREAEWERYENEIDKRDTWNAMTDGQYGEMPDGFDDDYDFMG